AILLPLTFIAGLYGMNGLDLNNINNLPLGFVIVLLTMAGVAAVLFFFKRKQWILTKQDNDDRFPDNNKRK
ncbi:MAG TPA: CorA family divalent cation transporter, partial [Nitrososphaeraceae archaeon]